MGCRRVADPTELVRLFVDVDGRPQIGPGPGRGAWLCRPPAALDCFDAALRRRALDRALHRSVPGHDVAAFRAKLAALNHGSGGR
ncbi:MAG TPA: YlxR family protein [Acidimicrobiia bacterium]|nr:YlxR family protein [Acidimicrobiia bacterium]